MKEKKSGQGAISDLKNKLAEKQADRKKKKGARTDIIARTSALIAHESTREYCCPRRG